MEVHFNVRNDKLLLFDDSLEVEVDGWDDDKR